MNTPPCTIHHLFAILTVVLAFPTATGQETPAPSSPVPGGCADSVISFSPCLPYISAPPNDLSSDPSSQCCDIFNGAFDSDSDDAQCLCYLVRQNSLLGFPLNITKLLSLSDLCPVNNNSQPNNTSNSLESTCSGSPTLPPMIATPKKPPSAGSDVWRPPPPVLHPPPPPPSTIITQPRPPANNASTQNIPKPSTSDPINNPDAAFFWVLVFGIMYFIVCQNLAGIWT